MDCLVRISATDTHAVIYTNRIDEEVLRAVDLIGNTVGVITTAEDENTIILRPKEIYMGVGCTIFVLTGSAVGWIQQVNNLPIHPS